MSERCRVWRHPGTSRVGFQCTREHGHEGPHNFPSTTQRTVIIWDSCGQEEIKFLAVSGDYRHLHDHYINQMKPEGVTEEEWNNRDAELNDLLSDEGRFAPSHLMLEEFPTKEVIEGAFVIVCGFVP